jgi:hypothetical protein
MVAKSFVYWMVRNKTALKKRTVQSLIYPPFLAYFPKKESEAYEITSLAVCLCVPP